MSVSSRAKSALEAVAKQACTKKKPAEEGVVSRQSTRSALTAGGTKPDDGLNETALGSKRQTAPPNKGTLRDLADLLLRVIHHFTS